MLPGVDDWLGPMLQGLIDEGVSLPEKDGLSKVPEFRKAETCLHVSS